MKKLVSTVALLSIAGNLLMAGGDIAPVEPVAVEEVVSDEWKFQLSPLFLWAQGIDGSNTVGPATVPLDIDFADALDNLAMTYTVHFEATKGDWTLFSEYQYVKLIPSVGLPNNDTMKIDFKDYIFELGGAYAFSRSESSKWEVLGGLRYTEQDLKTSLKSTGATLIDTSENWTDFFVGFRNTYTISDDWTLLSRADIGGGDSDFIWNATIMADYRINEWGSVFFGYKVIDYDYDNGESGLSYYAYDATQSGLLVGFNIHW